MASRFALDVFKVDKPEDYDTSQGRKGLERAELRGLLRDGGFSREKLIDFAKGFEANGGKIRNGAQEMLANWKTRLSKPSSEAEVETETPSAPVGSQVETSGQQSNVSPAQTIKSEYGSGPSLYAQQDNDITNSFHGDNNKVTNNVDNSVTQNNYDNSDNSRYYGGSIRNFTYKGGDGESRLYDSPVSAATMSGYYDVDDSPSANAKFVDMYTDLNNLNQREADKYYKKTGTFDYGSDKSRAFDPVRMMNRIDSGAQRSFDLSDRETARLFGDIWGKKPPKWNMPQTPEKIESNVEEIAEDYRDEIKS